MSEKQEKVWVVTKHRVFDDRKSNNWKGDSVPVKVFDDRKDARAYVKNLEKRARNFGYLIDGVLKG